MSEHIRQGTIDEPQREAGGDIKVIRHCLDDADVRRGWREPFTVIITCVSENRADAVLNALKRLQEDGPDR